MGWLIYLPSVALLAVILYCVLGIILTVRELRRSPPLPLPSRWSALDSESASAGRKISLARKFIEADRSRS